MKTKTAKKKPLPKKNGRPTKRTTAVVKRIIGGLAKGTPLTIICESSTMPSDDTVRKWAEDDPGLSRAIARAREIGFDRIAMDALEIADNAAQDTILTDRGGAVPNIEWIARSRLRVDTRLKLLAKWDPKRYGERVDLNHSGSVDIEVTIGGDERE